MAFIANIRLLTPIMRSMIASGPRAYLLARPATNNTAAFSSIASQKLFNPTTSLPNKQYQQTIRQLGSDPKQTFSRAPGQPHDADKPRTLDQILECEIQEEMAELNQRLSSDQFPGFSVETDGSDVKLTKQVGDSTVIVRFTVSSSLSEWKSEPEGDQPVDSEQQEADNYTLLSMPDFQVQIVRNGKTLEASCYFEEMEHDEESGQACPMDPLFHIDEIVMYEGEPRETEFAVSTEYFRDELQEGLLQYMSDHGIDDEFAKNLVSFSTNYEKKQYIGLMRRLKEFVAV